MVEELLAVIRGDDDERVRVVRAARAQRREEPRESRVGVADLGVVAPDEVRGLGGIERGPVEHRTEALGLLLRRARRPLGAKAREGGIARILPRSGSAN